MSQISLAIRRAQARTAINGLGLCVAAVEPMLRERARSAGLFRAGCDEIAGELSNALVTVKGGKVWPRHVRAAIEAMAAAKRPDGRPYIIWDGRLCVGYFVGHQNDERPRSYNHAESRERFAMQFTDCEPVRVMLDELDPHLDPDAYGKRKSDKGKTADTTGAKSEADGGGTETTASAATPPEDDSAAMVAALREHLPALPLPDPERMAVGTPLAGKLAKRWQSLQSDPVRAHRYLQALGRRIKGERLTWFKDGETVVSVASVDIICDDAVMTWLRGVQERARSAPPPRAAAVPKSEHATTVVAGGVS